MLIASAERLKSLFVQAKFTEHFVAGQYTSRMGLIVLLSYPQSGVILCSQFFHTCWKRISIIGSCRDGEFRDG